jgi:hypothetical protein
MEKDQMRIRDIITKAQGSFDKEIQLTTNMVNKITNVEKCIERGKACVTNNRPEMALLFLDKALQLDNSIRHTGYYTYPTL